MPEAVHAHSTRAIESAKPSRRGVMLATARLLALGGAAGAVAAVAPSPENPDAALIAMCERIVAANDEMLRLESPYYDKPSSPPHVQARTAALVVEIHRLAEAAAEVQAVTLDGLRAKGGALLSCMCYLSDGSPDWGNHDELLGWSIARDLKSFGPGAMPPVPAGSATPAQTGPDAAIVALCAEHAANVAAFGLHGGEVEQEHDPFWPPYERTCRAVSAVRPATMDGVLAKARAAKAEAGKDERCLEGGIAADWAWDIVNDLLRLHGGTAA